MSAIYKIFFNNISDFHGVLFDAFNVTVSEDGVISGPFVWIFVLAIVWIIVSYLIGSLNFSLIISKYIFHDDVRKYGSSNAGSSNMQRTYGNGAGAATLVCDMAKGILAVVIAKLLFGDNVAYLAGTFAIIGHCYPVFFGFKGGKGVATALAIILALHPFVALIIMTLYAGIVLTTRYISLASVISALCFPVVLDRYYAIVARITESEASSPTLMMVICSIFIAIFIVFKHRTNIKKLWNGNENKLSFKKKAKKAAAEEAKAPESLHTIDKEG